MEKLRVCILGATGMVGQQFVRLLDQHPYFELVAMTASGASVGKKYSQATEWLVENHLPDQFTDKVIIETELNAIMKEDVSLAFSALPSDIAGGIEASLAQSGVSVFSNASAHRMNPQVPILIPEINPNHINVVSSQNFGAGFIVTNSNCSVAGLAVGLGALQKFGLKSVIVTTYQALSGAGSKGVASLDIMGNIVPYIKDEEEKMELEAKKILGSLNGGSIEAADFQVNATCARVPVRDGHLESVVVETTQDIDIEDIRNAFTEFTGEPQSLNLPTAPEKPIVVIDKPDRPQPLKDLYLSNTGKAAGMTVTIGRVRKKENLLNFNLLVHNTIRGAAGASILNAEFAYAKHLLK